MGSSCTAANPFEASPADAPFNVPTCATQGPSSSGASPCSPDGNGDDASASSSARLGQQLQDSPPVLLNPAASQPAVAAAAAVPAASARDGTADAAATVSTGKRVAQFFGIGKGAKASAAQPAPDDPAAAAAAAPAVADAAHATHALPELPLGSVASLKGGNAAAVAHIRKPSAARALFTFSRRNSAQAGTLTANSVLTSREPSTDGVQHLPVLASAARDSAFAASPSPRQVATVGGAAPDGAAVALPPVLEPVTQVHTEGAVPKQVGFSTKPEERCDLHALWTLSP